MKHLPNELLYLLKIYNYIKYDIGIDHARSRAEDIREYIKNADYLDAYPTVKEYISEDKSIEEIITYIQRNEKTYTLLGEWKDGEIESLFKAKGIEGAFGFIGNFSVKKDEDNGYFLLPCNPCCSNKIVLLNADLCDDVNVEKILWLEFYKTQDGMCLEIFDDNCNTVKIFFSDFEVKKTFHSAAILSRSCKTPYDSAVKMSSVILEKYEYDNALLNEDERSILPIIKFMAKVKSESIYGEHPEMDALFSEYKIAKGNKLLGLIAHCEDPKRSASLSKKTARLLKSKKCAALIERINSDIILSQINVSAL